MQLRPLILLAILGCTLGACKPSNTPSASVERQLVEVKDRDNSGFDELSSDYYASDSRVIWQKPDLVLRLLGPLRGKTVADIGAGTGFFAFRVANAGAKVLAIDIDPRAIGWMESEKSRYPADVQALLETRLATADSPNLRPNEVDLILMVNTYIYIADRITYFRSLRPGLRREARVVIIDFKDHETPIGPPVNERISLNRVQHELVESGYTIIETDEKSLEYQYILIAGL